MLEIISHHILLTSIIIIFIFLSVKYLINSGYFKKIGLDFGEIKKQVSDIVPQQQEGEDFFAPPKELEQGQDNSNDFFNTSNYSNIEDSDEDVYSTDFQGVLKGGENGTKANKRHRKN